MTYYIFKQLIQHNTHWKIKFIGDLLSHCFMTNIKYKINPDYVIPSLFKRTRKYNVEVKINKQIKQTAIVQQ